MAGTVTAPPATVCSPIDATAARKTRLLSVLSGRQPCFIASDLAIGDGPTIAPAFVGGSLSSTSGADFNAMVEASPRVRYVENMQRGYHRILWSGSRDPDVGA